MKHNNMFEDFDMKKVKARDKLNKILSVRMTQKDFEWLRSNRVSATKLFNYILHKIMERENQNEPTEIKK